MTQLKHRLLIFFLSVCTAVVVAGCASQPSRLPQASASEAEIVLPGGGIEHARLLAMGMAQSKGWRIAEAEAEHLLLERNLSANAPQARLLSGEGATAEPKLQVETHFSKHRDGVRVSLRSYVITNPGTDAAQRIDYTADYQDELLISLNALASAWLANRERIASKIPIPPDPDSAVQTGSGTTAYAEDPSQPTTATEDRVGPGDERPPTSTTTAAAAAAASPPREPLAIPRSTTSTAYAADSALASNDATEPAENQMLALDQQRRRGIWAFYAEASARERGCAVSERGAVLLDTTPPFELHEVQCDNGENLLLQCQGGICRQAN